MPRSVEELLEEALRMPPEERARIARTLFGSLQSQPPADSLIAKEATVHPGRLTMLIETEQETDGRWLGEIPELPGVLTYGDTAADAMARAQALALRVLADRLEHGDIAPDLLDLTFRIQ